MAFDTIRLYLIPIRRTAAWMSTNWPKDYINICQNLRLSRRNHHASTYNEEEGNPVLTIHQVLDFLDWLTRNNKPCQLAIGVALQGLVGLQMLEALRLRWENVDLNENTIIIDGLVKNRYRIRKIPIPNVVAWMVLNMRKSIDQTGIIISDFADYYGYSHAVQRELHNWDTTVTIKPKDLRNTIQTASIDGGWYGYYVQRYVGHSPSTIGEKHYHGDQGKRIVPLFKEKVVSYIESEIATWPVPEDCLILQRMKLVVSK